MAEHGPFQIPLVDAKAQEQAQQATEEPVAQRQEHLAKSEGRPTPAKRRGQSADRVSLPHSEMNVHLAPRAALGRRALRRSTADLRPSKNSR